MLEKIPEEWKTEALLLLVGGNALPNFVAARLLLKPGGTLHMLKSTATSEVAQALAATTGGACELHEIANPASKSAVADVVADVLDRYCRGVTTGLHYTGGTKSMAVHAHAEVRRRRPDAVLTYLDSRTLHLYSDGSIGSVPVQYSVTPTIVDLLKLHGLQLTHEDRFVASGVPQSPRIIMSQLNRALAQAHQTPEGSRAYNDWCQAYLRDRKRGALVEKVQHFPTLPVPFPDTPALSDVAQQMRVEFNVTTDAFDPKAVVDRGGSGLKSIGELVGHLDGKWLEHYVAEALMANQSKHNLSSIGMSLDIDGRQSPYDFEVDVGALQGYQLYAVSCTRSAARGLCKSKMFEALIRAQQLGGSEAKTALVCAYDSPEILEQQIRDRWRPETSARVRVFGAKHLPDLTTHLGFWLEQP
jgi:hypothetical protein